MCTELFIQRSSAKAVNLPAALQGSTAPSLSDLEEQLLLTSSPLSRSFSSHLPSVSLFLLLFLLSSVCALRPWADDGFSPRLSHTFKFSLVHSLFLLLPFFASVPSSTSPARKASSACHSLASLFPRLPGPASSDPPWAFLSLSSWQPESLLASFLSLSLCSASVIHTLAFTRPAAPPCFLLFPPLFWNFPSLSQPQSLLSIKASILPCSHLTLCLDGSQKAAVAVSSNPPGERKGTGRKRKMLSSIHALAACEHRTRMRPPLHCSFFLMIYLLRGSLSAPKSSGR